MSVMSPSRQSPALAPAELKRPHSRLAAAAANMRAVWASDFRAETLQTLATRGGVLVIGAATSVLAARVLGPEAWGRVAVGLALTAFGVQLATLGLHSSSQYYVARRPRLLPALTANALAAAALLGGGIILAAALVLYLWPQAAPLGGVALAIALAAIPVGLGAILLQSLLIGIRAIAVFNRTELAGRTAVFLLVATVAAGGFASPETVLLAMLTAPVLAGVWSLRYLRRVATGSLRISTATFRATLRYGIRAHLAALFAFLLLRIDLLMVRYILGSEATGYYSVAVALADLLYILPTVVAMLLFPRLAALRDHGGRWRIARLATIAIAVLIAPLAIAVGVGAEPLIAAAFGEAFRPAAGALAILAAAMVFYAATTMVSIYHAALGFPWLAVQIWIAAAGLNILLNLLLIPRYALAGAAAASLVCYASVLFALYAYAAVGAGHAR